MHTRTSILAAAAACLLLLSSCDDTITGDELILSELDVSFVPNPVDADVSGNSDYQWVASFTVTLTESAGTGATINSVVASVNETSNGIAIITDEDEIFLLEIDSETNRVEALSTASIDVQVFYTLPSGGTEATIDITVSVIDDNGLEVGGTLQVSVN